MSNIIESWFADPSIVGYTEQTGPSKVQSLIVDYHYQEGMLKVSPLRSETAKQEAFKVNNLTILRRGEDRRLHLFLPDNHAQYLPGINTFSVLVESEKEGVQSAWIHRTLLMTSTLRIFIDASIWRLTRQAELPTKQAYRLLHTSPQSD